MCVCVWCVVAGTALGTEAATALAPALGKLVSLTSLDLRGTLAVIPCHMEGVCVGGGVVQWRCVSVAM